MNTRKSLRSIARLAGLCLSIAFLTANTAHARTWTSADGKSSFEGDLISYNADTGDVTVNRGGKEVTFNQELLSKEDIAFLKSEKAVPVTAPAKPSPANSEVPPSDIPTLADYLAGETPEIEFSPAPKANDKKGWLIKNFGPVGIGIMLEKDFQMKINNVEEGSPAGKAGKLKAGQIIESINGVKLPGTGRDPRQVLGKLITDAEARDGRINLAIQGAGTVTVEIPVLGSYSDTWPLNCPKSDKIVRNLADLLAKLEEPSWGSVLFLLSTGEQKDLDVVRGWMKNKKGLDTINWEIGYTGIGICEYYLRTGDPSVLPIIKQGADLLRDRIYNGRWSGRSAHITYNSGGQLNAAGVHCLTFLLLAKTCGVDVDEYTLQSSLSSFFYFSGRGSVPYGDHTPKPGYADDNGKTSGLAVAMAAAARLTPGGKESIYAQATQVNAMKSYYGTNVYHMGHTGGGIGEIWKSASMGLMTEERPKQYRQYQDARLWILELSRRHNGGIGIAGGKEGNYDGALGEGRIDWGTFFALNYTLPRKHLHLFGAPLSPHAKTYALPEHPWGNAADNQFSSPYPAPGGPWSREDIYGETILEHAGGAVAKLLQADKVSDEALQTYFHHPEITHRFEAMSTMLRLKKYEMIPGLLKAEDARLRHVGIMALHELFGTWRPRNADPGGVTPEMMAEVDKIIRNPNESHWNRNWAIGLLQHVELEELRTYKELFLAMMAKDDPVGLGAILTVCLRLVTDKESYREMFPPMINAISKTTAYHILSRARQIRETLKSADPEIQDFCVDLLKEVYVEQPQELVSERGIYVIPGGGMFKRARLGEIVGTTEIGEDFLNRQPKVTSKWKASGRDEDLYVFDGKFKANPDLIGDWSRVSWTTVTKLSEAKAYIEDLNKKGKFPGTNAPRTRMVVNDKFTVIQTRGGIERHPFPMKYAGNMMFSTYIDKAYHFEVFNVAGRRFLMLENDFEPEKEPGFKTEYLIHAEVYKK